MRLRWTTSIVAALVLLGCASRGGGGPRGDPWVFLGQREVTDRLDHDRIVVTARRGDFTRIKLVVRRASVDFHRVVVHYGSGGSQDVALRHTIPAGGESRAIDLRGGDRVIRSVELWYDANTIRGLRATVRLFGRP